MSVLIRFVLISLLTFSLGCKNSVNISDNDSDSFENLCRQIESRKTPFTVEELLLNLQIIEDWTDDANYIGEFIGGSSWDDDISYSCNNFEGIDLLIITIKRDLTNLKDDMKSIKDKEIIRISLVIDANKKHTNNADSDYIFNEGQYIKSR